MDFTTSPTYRTTKLRGLLKLLRPKQWIKNGFVFMPLIFSGQFLEIHQAILVSFAFIACCLISSSAYIINDLHDIKQDKLHPIKSATRPLALGIISTKHALNLLIPIYVTLLTICIQHPLLFLPIGAYALLNLIYTYSLKREPVIDIFIISLGFVLRIYAGAMIIHIEVSAWMAITTLSLALYLGAIKRKQEFIHYQTLSRPSLEKYTLPLIDKYAQISAICAIMFYSLFVMTAKPQLTLTIPIVLFGIFRYWYIVECLDQGESPTDVLFEDWQLAATVLTWIAICAWMLWPAGT